MAPGAQRPSKAEPSVLRLRRPAPWAVVALLLFLSVLAALWWVGQGHEPWTSHRGPTGLHWLTNLWDWVAGIFAGAAEVLVPRSEGGAALSVRLACLTLLIFFFVALRRALLARTAHAPGPVEVMEFEDATPGGKDGQLVADLSAQFRKHLSETDLYPPSSLPAEAPTESFLSLLGEVDPAKIGSGLWHLFSRLRPKVAYRVTGVLRKRTREPSYGVTVAVTSLATRGSRTDTLWAKDWEEAVHKAGYWVMATILPVTRASWKPPWQNWRGKNLPPDLFAAYQKGRELSRDRKFDEALEEFYTALLIDPANLYLRTQIAATQEKMGLHLDALETYHGALTLGRLSTEMENEYLWFNAGAGRIWYRVLKSFGMSVATRKKKHPRLRYFWWSRVWYVWQWRRQPGFLNARYRYAVVLGTSEETAEQWCKRDEHDHPQRAAARKEIQNTLGPALAERYWPALVSPADRNGGDAVSSGAKRYLENLLGDPEKSTWSVPESSPERRELTIRLVFQLACLQEINRLCQDYPFARLLGRTRSDIPITWSARRINRYIWAPLRLAWAMDTCSEAGVPMPPWTETVRSGEPPAQKPPETDPREPFALARSCIHALYALLFRRREKAGWPSVSMAARHLFQRDLESTMGKAWPSGLRPQELKTRVELARTRFIRQRHQDWQDHYNAACALAVAMHRQPTVRVSRTKEEVTEFRKGPYRVSRWVSSTRVCAQPLHTDPSLAELAVAELENAVRGAESAVVALKRSWLLAEDPDLAELRREDGRFTRFEREMYPHKDPNRLRSDDVPVKIEMTAYDRALLADLALVMERTWHARAAEPSATLHEVLQWTEDEADVWECLCKVTRDQARNWLDRATLLNRIRDVADRDTWTRTRVRTRVPECDEVMCSDGQPGSNGAVVARLDKDLEHLGGQLLSGSAHSPIDRSHKWADKIREDEAQGWGPLSPNVRQALCARYAGAWQGLHDLLLNRSPQKQEQLRLAFSRALANVLDPGTLTPRSRVRPSP